MGGSPPILLVLCEDGKERSVVVRGKFANKVWMNADDYVLITCNCESGTSGEVSCKYNSSEVSQLQEKKEITSTMFNLEEDNSFITFTNDKVNEDKVDEYYSSMNTPLVPQTHIAMDECDDNDITPTPVTLDDDDELDFDDITPF